MRQTEFDAHANRCRRGVKVSLSTAAVSAMSTWMTTVERPTLWYIDSVTFKAKSPGKNGGKPPRGTTENRDFDIFLHQKPRESAEPLSVIIETMVGSVAGNISVGCRSATRQIRSSGRTLNSKYDHTKT